ncbi:lysyl-tRNA synthetase [Xylariomycetidae sp. FL2044]|nr:lysyl-tRNA synthetase [Xylariomycetidae sp. FL2044]
MHGHYLRFLRPYLYGPRAISEAAYAPFAFAFASSHRAGSSSPNGCPQRRTAAQRRYSHGPSRGPDEDVLDDRSAQVELRVKKLRDSNALNYPRHVSRANIISIPSFRDKYKDVGTTRSPEEVVLHGRIMSVRRAGSKLLFMNILGDYQLVQVMININRISTPQTSLDQVKEQLHPFRRGDIISVAGHAVRTTAGELTLEATEIPRMLTPGLSPLPEKLINEETMALNRHVKMLVHKPTTDILRLRSHVMKFLRDFFHQRDFLEVQTPILVEDAGGATARPFRTVASEFPSKELSLRIAPELWLKRLVVGGNDRVFELGPAFRNEGLDNTHNPEFTMCEFYSAYSNLSDLIVITTDMISGLFKSVAGLQLTLHKEAPVSLPDGPWKIIEFIPGLEERLGFKLPDLSEPDAFERLVGLLKQTKDSETSAVLTLPKLLDHLAKDHLECDSVDQPLFITHHPACMSPLSKSFTCPQTGQAVSARAELFIGAREIANMYEEENSPFEQRKKFKLQVEARTTADDEGPAEVDESYVQALQYGLPPTGGWGCGVDRLVMFLSGTSRISDTLSFGNLRNVVSLSQAAARTP